MSHHTILKQTLRIPMPAPGKMVWGPLAVALGTLGFATNLLEVAQAVPTPSVPAQTVPAQTVPLPTGKFLTPLGKQTPVGSYPVNLVLSPDGQYVVVTNVGAREYVSVLSARDGHLVSQVGFNGKIDPLLKMPGGKNEGLFYGLVFGPTTAGKTLLYASRGTQDFVSILTLDGQGHLVNTGKQLNNRVASETVPTDGPQPHHVAGLALSADGKRLFVANNTADPAQGLRSSLSILDTADQFEPIKSAVNPATDGTPADGTSTDGTPATADTPDSKAPAVDAPNTVAPVVITPPTVFVKGGALVAQVTVSGYPFGVAAVTRGPNAGQKVYVSSEQAGSVSVIDPRTGHNRELKRISTGTQPCAMVLDKAQRRLFVANAGSDTVSIIDTATDEVTETVLLRPNDARGLPGATPTGLALSPDETQLFVTLADMNAVAVVSVPTGIAKALSLNQSIPQWVSPSATLQGYIPVGWNPTSCVVSRDGKRLFVANAKGVAVRNPNNKPVAGLASRGQAILNIIEGTVSTIPIPAASQMHHLTAQTVLNNQLELLVAQGKKAVPFSNPGIKHVIYIIKENRTYDQVLGDLPQGNGDPRVLLFGREVTPNLHALAERFALLDNYYCCAEVSADGWNWSTSGMVSAYTSRNVPYSYGGHETSYNFEGLNNGVPVDLKGMPNVGRAPGGYIWDLAINAGLSVRNYGFFTYSPTLDDDGKPLKGKKPTLNLPSQKKLVGRTDENYRSFDLTYADSEAWIKYDAATKKQLLKHGAFDSPSRFTEWKREFDDYVKKGDLPRFSTIRLPRDHTEGTKVGVSTPRAMVADNDYGVGQIVDAVSHSPFWKSTAIFIVEDDAQNGYDHVDAHRSTCYVISPFVQKGTHDNRFYNTDSTLRTMELLMGLQPMSQYDAIASPLRVFGAQPGNAAPYDAILPARSVIASVNTRTAYRAKDSERLLNSFAEASGPDEELNDILWHSIKGRNVPAPARRYGLKLSNKVEKDDDD